MLKKGREIKLNISVQSKKGFSLKTQVTFSFAKTETY